MSEQQPAKTPLIDLLRYTPKDAVAQVSTPTSSQNIPYGRLCHEAADELQAMQERIKALEAVAEAAVRMWNSDGLTDDLVQSLQNAGYSVEIGEHL